MDKQEVATALLVGLLGLFVITKCMTMTFTRASGTTSALRASGATHDRAQPVSNFLGCIVRLKNVASKSKLNGQRAVVVSHEADGQRYMVHLLDVSSRPTKIAADNLELADPLRAAISNTRVGDITNCNELAPALVRSGVLSMDLRPRNFHNLDKLPQRPNGRQHWYQIMLYGCQHELNINVVKAGDGSMYARVFQCFDGSNTYSAKEWLKKQHWMNFAEYAQFIDQLRIIRKKTKDFVRDELLHHLALPPGMSPCQYADMIIGDTHIGGGPNRLHSQPASVEVIESYIRNQMEPGLDPEKICGGLRVGSEFCIYFRIGPWRDLMQLYQKVFHGTSVVFPLLALKYEEQIMNGLEIGYCWMELHISL
jgi:hypothetical protein